MAMESAQRSQPAAARRRCGLLAGTVIDALFPPACPACRGDTASSQTLCRDCWAETSFLTGKGCTACGRDIQGLGRPGADVLCDTCQVHPPVWDRGAAVFAYEGTGRRLVLALKHGDRLDMLPMLAGWMLRAGRHLVGEADLVAPVPMHWTRRLRRRFNQSAELAGALCRGAGRGAAFAPSLLRRIRRTASQDGRDRAGREENIRGCIGVAGSPRPMQPVEIYTTPFCGYCHIAKRLLNMKKIPYVEIDVSADPALRAAMMERSGGRRSVPQIFVGRIHVGGCDELYALERAGRLDPLLAA